TRRVAEERAEAAALVVEVERERPVGVEEVRLDEAEQEQLAQARDLRLHGERLAAAKQVVLRDLRLGDEVLDAREAGADLERAGRALGDLDVDLDELVGRAALGRHDDVLEEAERHDAALGDLEVRVVEQLALGDLHLAADHLVAGLGVAADVDALEVRALAARHLERQRDLALVEVDL